MSCNRFVILFTQIIHKNTKNKENILILQCSTLKNTVVLHSSWYTGAASREQARVTNRRREGLGDCRPEGSSAMGDGGQAAIPLTPDAGGTHIHIFEMLQLEGSYVGGLYPALWVHFCSVWFLSPVGYLFGSFCWWCISSYIQHKTELYLFV